MAFGRKARRIAELEKELDDAMNNLAIAHVHAGHPALQQAITVEKGAWYQVSYRYRHNGSSLLDIADLFVAKGDSALYFEGESQ
jgi:hypothetical protein